MYEGGHGGDDSGEEHRRHGRLRVTFGVQRHRGLFDYKKDQNRVQKSGDYFIFPGGGTQFKEGITSYIEFVEKGSLGCRWYGSSTESMCWKVFAKTVDASGIGLVIYQKPVSYSCYKQRKDNYPPLCERKQSSNSSWYVPLSNCISRLPVGGKSKLYNWPAPWPQRLSSKPPSLSAATDAEEAFNEDTKHWSALVFDVSVEGLAKNWSSVRNVMDMNSSYR